MRSVRDRLLMSLTELQTMVTMDLVRSLHAQSVNSMEMCIGTDDVTQQIIDKQMSINEIIKEAEEQEEIQRMIKQEELEYWRLEGEVNKLQQQLRQSHQVLEAVVGAANDKTDQTKAATDRKCTVSDLLSYSHLISSSFSVQMPGNWSEMDHRRPYPTDLDMRAGELGKLAVECGSLPELDRNLLSDRDNQQPNLGAWKQNLPTQPAAADSLLPVKLDTLSSSDDDMETVT